MTTTKKIGSTQVKVTRLLDGPIIHAGMDERMLKDGDFVNINGPSCIRVPSWVKKPLGRYYLYFAHHKGSYIRLAFADAVAGPWTVYEPGVLSLEDSGFPTTEEGAGSSNLGSEQSNTGMLDLLKDYAKVSSRTDVPHIASPEVFVDEKNERLSMTYHGWEGAPLRASQVSRVATSKDGLHWTCVSESPAVADPVYTRGVILLSMPGIFMWSKDGLPPYNVREMTGSKGNWVWGEPLDPRLYFFSKDFRHAGLMIKDNKLLVFWSKVGDNPERILMTEILLDEDWTKWKVTGEGEILRPEKEWKGANEAMESSVRGEVTGMVNQLRDPAILRDQDGVTFLFYTGAGEQNIGVVNLEIVNI